MNKILTDEENQQRREAAIEPCRTVSFYFALNQWVLTPHNEKGYVSLLGFGNSGPLYNVSCPSGKTEWWREVELRPVVATAATSDAAGATPAAEAPDINYEEIAKL